MRPAARPLTVLPLVLAVLAVLIAAAGGRAQLPPPAVDTLGDGPWIFDSSTRGPSGSPIRGPKYRVVATKGLSRPYALAFLPGGDMLVTERAGRLRLIRSGVLDPEPIAGIPPVCTKTTASLLEKCPAWMCSIMAAAHLPV